MANGIGIGSLFGIPVELDWTFIMLLLLVLVLGYFTIVVILFAMVLLHELGHSLMARHYKVKVKKIILFPLGGASIIDLDELSPEISFGIAVSGPLVSVLLTAVFGIAYFYQSAGFIGNTLYVLFILNGILAASNFIPAFPLDGGRILKSYMERHLSRLDATKKTVLASKVILSLYIIASTAYALYYYSSDLTTFVLLMLWNFIVAIFIWGGAQAELESIYLSEYTKHLRVYNLISKDFIVVKPETTMHQLYTMLLKQGARSVLFLDGSKVKMVSGITARALKGGPGGVQAKVSDFADEIPAVDYGTNLSKAISKMRYEQSGIIAVVKKGKIAGILLADRIEALAALHVHTSAHARTKSI